MPSLVVRIARPGDIPQMLELQRDCYPVLATIAQWRAEHLASHQRNFPEGQFVADAGGRVVGYCATLRVPSGIALQPHTFREITGRGTFDTHDPAGDVLYGAEIMVHPDYRRRGIAKRFYQVRFDLVRRSGIRYFAAGGRMPGFAEHRHRMDADSYVRAVVAGRLTDRTLTAQLRSGLEVRGVLPEYLTDPKSGNYATLLVWENPRSPARAPPAAAGASPAGTPSKGRRRAPARRA